MIFLRNLAIYNLKHKYIFVKEIFFNIYILKKIGLFKIGKTPYI